MSISALREVGENQWCSWRAQLAHDGRCKLVGCASIDLGGDFCWIAVVKSRLNEGTPALTQEVDLDRTTPTYPIQTRHFSFVSRQGAFRISYNLNNILAPAVSPGGATTTHIRRRTWLSYLRNRRIGLPKNTFSRAREVGDTTKSLAGDPSENIG